MPTKKVRKRVGKSLRVAENWRIGQEVPRFDASWHENAGAFLDSESSASVRALRQSDPKKWLLLTSARFKKASQRQHIKSLAAAYAFWITTSSNAPHQQLLTDHLIATRKRLTKQTELLHAAVEVFIEYEVPGSLHNRDVQAIRHLFDRGVLPSDVNDLAENEGEGLDIWARKGREKGGSRSKRRRKSISAAKLTKSKGNIVSWVRDGEVVTSVKFPDNANVNELLKSVFRRLEEYTGRRVLELAKQIGNVISAENISMDDRKRRRRPKFH